MGFALLSPSYGTFRDRECCKFNPTGKSLRFYRIVSSLVMKNILLYRNENQAHNLPVSRPRRDVSRSSRYVGHGCDGRCGVAVISSPDENAAAYGEIVWFWRRDPG